MARARDAYGCLFLTKALLLPPNHPPLISATPDVTAVPVKASQKQAGQTINNDYLST